MSTNRGSWNVRAGMFMGAWIAVVWVVGDVVDSVIRDVPLTEAIARLHPGSYVLGAINGCVAGLLAAWMLRGPGGEAGSSKQDRGRTL